MRRLALWGILIYQRYISPYKGFVCAYRLHTGRVSCSKIGYRAISRFGIVGGIATLRKRIYLCGVAHSRMPTKRIPGLYHQRGECDFGGCDLPCDILSNCGSCDFGGSKKDEKKERHVHLPPDIRVK